MWFDAERSEEVPSEDCFRIALKVWIDKPHTINRRLNGIKPVSERRLKPAVLDSDDTLTTLTERLSSVNIDGLPGLLEYFTHVSECSWKGATDIAGYILERDLLPKQIDKFSPLREVVTVFSESAVFYNISKTPAVSPSVVYRLRFGNDSRIHLDLFKSNSEDEVSGASWLKDHVLPKVAKWACSEPLAKGSQLVVPSLSQVPIEKYSTIYFNLKKKYGKHLCEIWPETTDPLKYVYEDIAIASYLLYDGIGVDVRKRKIWDLFGSGTKLMEEPITPETRFPEYSWWIGNHSDELTPWIPYLASRSRPDARVFLLPCCPFTFHGKYQRQHGGMSQYQSYLLFLQGLCQDLGFDVVLDRLRIPSTKRICLVCSPGVQSDPYAAAKTAGNIQGFIPSCIDSQQEPQQRQEHKPPHVDKFEPRAKTEAVRNCTQLDRGFLDCTVDHLARKLLQMDNETLCASPQPLDDGHWQKGGSLHLRELAELLSKEDLNMLKSQCGGLQTLIRNHKHIFQVDKGLVSLNIPTLAVRNVAPPSKKISIARPRAKRKQCWFHRNHPQGCPLQDGECTFIHE
ncbi:hypothetical protein V5799_012401 [Amblyomma americanum]|uniref:tRNA (uracil-O(2)-)-methyltransferase n=1 Tax=Amblyomma americanum TaxID=6943 RepID=A0AAQ4EEI6_AMBAM